MKWKKISNQLKKEKDSASKQKDLPKSDNQQVKEKVDRCGVCQLPSKSKCSNCKRVYYCCKEHQKSDYKIHEKICKLNISKESVLIPKEKRFLLIGGAMFNIKDDFWIQSFSKHLNKQNIKFDVIEMKK
jgi:hypothetical protein